MKDADAVVHAVGFSSTWTWFNAVPKVVSGSTRAGRGHMTASPADAFNAIDATANRLRLPFAPRTPFAFVSCAESGWPGDGTVLWRVQRGTEWLRRYVKANEPWRPNLWKIHKLRPVVYRPRSSGAGANLPYRSSRCSTWLRLRALRGPHDSRRDFSRRYRPGMSDAEGVQRFSV